MSQSYLGEIRLFAGNFAPVGWLFCDGQFLAISENDALFNLIGTTYGGDGQSTFALPDLRGRLPMHQGGGFTIGQPGGVETVTLTTQQIPSHTHGLLGSNDIAHSPNPGQSVIARSAQINAFINANPSVAMSPQFIAGIGNNLPHTNFQPYLCVNFIISQYGIYPPPG
jgi:microcystin-dependent protein